jgi:hypothetical protein
MPNYIGPKEIDEWKKEIPFRHSKLPVEAKMDYHR